MSTHPVPSAIWSVGHSNHPMATLLGLLHAADIEVVADLRSQPFSRFNPHVNRGPLEQALAGEGLGYAWFGDRLGGRPPEPEMRDEDGRVDYVEVARSDRFRVGVDRLLEASACARVAMLCSEEDPSRCHRRLLVTPALVERGVAVVHLRGDRTAVSEAELAARLEADRPPTLF